MPPHDLPPELARENVALAQSWDRFPSEHLDRYLVSEVEDPRINCQSILTRSLIVDTLWPGEFNDLINEELRFGAILTWLFRQLKTGTRKGPLLRRITDRDPGVPELVLSAFDWLQSPECPVPDYIADALFDGDAASREGLTDTALDVFSTLWQCELSGREHEPVSLLEPACGSANDYRFMQAYGLERFLNYTGFDTSTRNIENATTRCPDVDFRVLSVFDTGLDDRSYDFVVVHDLFEHLSAAGIETALAEVMRVTRHQAWLHFFNLDEIDRHDIRPTENYHWNLLSRRQIVESLEPLAADIQVTSIPQLLEGKFGFKEHYNRQAATLVVTVKGTGP